MAKGDVVVFDKTKLNIVNHKIDLSKATDFRCMLITSLPDPANPNPDTSNYVEAQGGGYTQGGIALTTTLTLVDRKVVFDSPNNPLWQQNNSGPKNIKAALIYSVSAPTEDALCFIDLTVDEGTTPVTLRGGEIRIVFSNEGIFSLS